MEILILSTLSLFGRQWSQWEILTISMGVLFLLVWMTKEQRSKKVQSKYNKDQFLDSSPLIGRKLGVHNQNHQVVRDWKKDRLAPVQKHQNTQHQHETIKDKQATVSFEKQISELTAENEKLQSELARFEQAETQNEQNLQTKEFLEKLQEEIKLLQNETFHHKQANIRFEQQVTELTTHNEKLQRELDKSKQAESQNKQNSQTLEKLHEEIKQLQDEITEHKQAKISFEQQVSELTAETEKLQRELTESKQAKSQNKQNIQILEKLNEEIKQLQNEMTEHKQAKINFEQQVSELTAETEKLQRELARFEQVESQIAEMAASCRPLQTKDSQVEQISEQQVMAGPATEKPVKRKTARKSKACEQRHRTVDGVRQKLCQKCKEWKPESEFHKNSSSRDGMAGSCKVCKNNTARESRKQREAAQQ